MAVALSAVAFKAIASPAGAAVALYPTEQALILAGDVDQIMDAAASTYGADNYVTAANGVILDASGNIVQESVAASIYAPWIATDADGQKIVKFGTNADGSANTQRTALRGGASFLLPATPWALLWLGTVDNLATTATLYATSDGTTKIVCQITTDGRVRFYSSFSGTFVQTNAGVITAGTRFSLLITCDGTTTNLYVNSFSTVTISSTTAIPPALPSRVLREGSYNNAGTDPGGGFIGSRELLIPAHPSSANLAARLAQLKAEVLRRHPSMTLT